MRFKTFVGVYLLATTPITLADEFYYGPFKPNKQLWGEGGKPNTLQARAASTTSTSATSASSKVPDAACTNGPLTRQCWSSGYSSATDFDAKWPTTGKTRVYSFELTNSTCTGDGSSSKPCQKFNNQYPGPPIYADWGDTIQVTVKNSLGGNGTGIHWHGIRQWQTNPEDGTPGITECPLAPGDTKTYTFKATQHGSTWYHSHYSSQYGEGAFGAIIINGPASANYDIDLGPYIINDYYYKTAFQVAAIAHQNLQRATAPPPADTIMVNGTNKSPSGQGKYSQVTLTKGKKHRLRIINASVDNSIRVSLDGHPFQVINSDLVPIKPYNTNWVLLVPGQRYDVIINANQTSSNYWFRAEPATDCASSNKYDGKGVFTYSDATAADPTSSSTVAAPNVCKDESPLVPWVSNTVGSVDAFKQQAGNLQVDLGVEQVTTNGQNIVFWGVNLTAIDVDWNKPILTYLAEKNYSFPKSENLIELPTEGIWSYWIIQETPGTVVPIPHPIHLHGHDFYVLGQGSGTFDLQNTPNTLTYNNPPRRDTAILPGGGWLAIAFPTDNPGAWLLHCHIAWHVGDGLAVQFLEDKADAPLGDSSWQQTCNKWIEYDQNPVYPKSDSGL